MALLVRTGLHQFAKWAMRLPEVDPKLVQTFLETYKPLERRAELLKLAPILLDVSHVRENFWLPIDGPSVTNLGNLQYNVAQCFQVGVTLKEPNEKGVLVELKKVPKDALLPDWKHWVSWVQTYLELDEDSLQVSLARMVRAAMAIRAGHTLNWAKFLTRQLHEALVAIQKNPNGQFVVGQHLTHLIRIQLGPVQLHRVKMIKLEDSSAASEGETSTGQPMLFDPKAKIKRRINELQQLVDSPTEAELLLENLQATNAQLVRDLEDARKEIEDSILKREELVSHYETLLQDKQVALEDLEHQLGRAKARVYDLDTDLRVACYAIRKAEDALEQQTERKEFT